MSSSDDYIIIEGAKNTSDDTLDDDNTPVHNEAEQASLVALENQGVFVAQEEATTDSTEPRDDFSKELEDVSGIEIIPNDEEGFFA